MHIPIDSIVLGGIAVGALTLGAYFAGSDYSDVKGDVLSESRIKSYPFVAGLSLVTIDILIEYVGPVIFNYFFMFYVGLAGTNCIWFLFRALVHIKSKKLFNYPSSKSLITEFLIPSSPVPFCIHDIPIYLTAIAINVYYFKTKDPIANNIIAFSISAYAVLSIRVEKFTSAAPLLWSLLIYDVFFVYQTDVMTSVAANLDGPVKLVYGSKNRGYSILGLGDIVIPGMFISVCSRFDTFMKKITGKFSPYLLIAVIFYAIAMGVTDYVCAITHKGQPALLFIAPIVTIPIVTTAILRKEYRAFCSFSG